VPQSLTLATPKWTLTTSKHKKKQQSCANSNRHSVATKILLNVDDEPECHKVSRLPRELRFHNFTNSIFCDISHRQCDRRKEENRLQTVLNPQTPYQENKNPSLHSGKQKQTTRCTKPAQAPKKQKTKQIQELWIHF